MKMGRIVSKEISRLIESAPAGQAIADACDSIKFMLLKKNISYGNSALNPVRIFSNLTSKEGLYARIDDKLSRLKNNQSYPNDNDIDDLIGYLVLLKVESNSSELECDINSEEALYLEGVRDGMNLVDKLEAK